MLKGEIFGFVGEGCTFEAAVMKSIWKDQQLMERNLAHVRDTSVDTICLSATGSIADTILQAFGCSSGAAYKEGELLWTCMHVAKSDFIGEDLKIVPGGLSNSTEAIAW